MTNQPAVATPRPANQNENDIEVFTRTIPLLLEYCVACGDKSKVRASYSAIITRKDETTSDLYFCAHHIRKHEDKLKGQGFVINPENTAYDAGSSAS